MSEPPAGACVRWEWKVVLGVAEAIRVARRAARLLARDPYTLAAPDGGYPVASVYLAPRGGPRRGTPHWRVRRYGDDRLVWLERKENVGGRVTKRRRAFEAALASGPAAALPPGHPARAWFEEVEALQLAPCVVVSYLREAWIVPGTSARLTIDRHVRARPAARRTPESVEGGVPVLEAGVLELKFDDAPPEPFRRLLRAEGLSPRPWSKVRAAVEALERRPLLTPRQVPA